MLGAEFSELSTNKFLRIEDGAVWCSLCLLKIRPVTAKSIKQHIKSRPHKEALTKGVFPSHSDNRDHRVDSCDYCLLVDPDHSVHDLLTCIPPKLILNVPTKRSLSVPFITTHSGSLRIFSSESCEQSFESTTRLSISPIEAFGSLLDSISVSWGGLRVPNLDINGSNIQPSSAKEALLLVRDQLTVKNSALWVSFQADHLIEDPIWWPSRSNFGVPGYTNLILTKGQHAGIGLHHDVDHYTPSVDPGREPREIATYLTLASGTKSVLLLEPEFSSSDFTLREKHPMYEFSVLANEKILSEFKKGRGYLFTLKNCPDGSFTTLFIPPRWQHWLVAEEPASIIFGGSYFVD
uniref:Uncharacterized protein n=1 Tax=Timspurckia oligopyrenoides TaxID=708627 RepID=A0A7S0ZHR2_9RHOD|mmetsp:Transcript_5840/g.10348  ORF Transcript_5840/g.10348 Transcript_5840/m.10348 type:complete len:350 (+) Transcript_5840:139-1188(+)